MPAELVTFDEHVAVLEELLDAFSIDRCVLCGDSNMVAAVVEVAARHPDRVEALTLVAGGVVHHPDDLTRTFVSLLRTNPTMVIERFVEMCIPEEEGHSLRRWLTDIITRTGGERAAALTEAFYGVDVSDPLPRLTMPAVVIQGEKDAFSTSNLEAARALVAQLPHGTLEVLPGIGHVPTLTRPLEVAAIIEKLIERIEP